MSDNKQNPTLDLKINVPVNAVMGKFFKEGENKYGKWFGYNVSVGGTEYTYFADERTHAQLKDFDKGAAIVMTKEEHQGQNGGRNWFSVSVRPPLFDDHGRVEQPPKPAINAPNASNDDYEAFCEKRVARMARCIKDASNAHVQAFQEYFGTPDFVPLSEDGLLRIALSLYIAETKEK